MKTPTITQLQSLLDRLDRYLKNNGTPISFKINHSKHRLFVIFRGLYNPWYSSDSLKNKMLYFFFGAAASNYVNVDSYIKRSYISFFEFVKVLIDGDYLNSREFSKKQFDCAQTLMSIKAESLEELQIKFDLIGI